MASDGWLAGWAEYGGGRRRTWEQFGKGVYIIIIIIIII